MKPEILEIQPMELKFIFELKKQSTCYVQMTNKTDRHVAFKIKTTNPKKYCVRPNAGVIDPNAPCEFEVTMQAPKVAPPDMISRDKFLVQSTFVPEGTQEEDVTSSMFAKEEGKIVDEKKLKVLLISPPGSPESSPKNEPLMVVHSSESRELKDEIIQKNNSHATVDESVEVSKVDVSKVDSEREEVPKKEESFERKEAVKKIEEPVKPSQEVAKRNEEFTKINNTDELILAKDVEELKSKLKELESQLIEAKATILNLSEDKRSVAEEKHCLQGELEMVRSKKHRAQVGFPLLFVFMVGLVSFYLGHLLHS